MTMIESRETPVRRSRKSRYTQGPRLARERASIYEVMLRVMTATTTVSAAATELGMARTQFQSSLHKAQAAFIGALPEGRTGRPKKAEVLRGAEAKNRAQARTIERQRVRINTLEAQLEATSALIRSQMSLPATTTPKARPSSKRRSPRSRTSRAKTTKNRTEDASRVLAFAGHLEDLGHPRRDVSVATGVAVSTMRRWRAQGPPARRSGMSARPQCDAATTAAVEALVRSSKGVFGAEALRRKIGGVSRRDAAVIKAITMSKIERERRAKATRIHVTTPGVVRGFDAMHLTTPTGPAYSLRAQDGSIPYTTTLDVVSRYDEAAVLATLERDFREHEPPYVLRLDRASVHRTERVKQLCANAGVLVLHGPPRCARFYGQLERTHRDLRVFAPLAECRTIAQHASELERARVLLNNDWCRRSLGYETAEQRWNKRIVPDLDRAALRDQVLELTVRIGEEDPKLSPDECHRFAMVAVMVRHDILRQIPGGHC